MPAPLAGIAAAAARTMVQGWAATAAHAAATEAAEQARAATMRVVGKKELSDRFMQLRHRTQRKIRWNALRDASNHYRNAVRKAWRRLDVKRPEKLHRRAIARSYDIKKRKGDAFTYVRYKNPRARIAHLLEWDHNYKAPSGRVGRVRGYEVGTGVFEAEKTRMYRIIQASTRRQIETGKENAAARRKAVRLAVGLE